ncbi:galactose-1-epimerase [Streptomyces sp. Ru73]|uniref:aldose epimerase family protein n=1 Tax=Streptomyces sp. Ru73 TaxID=2080748 RepID=UPI000CDDFB0D|nr:aldose epimerase family protein [Streptomyces sp. Ru73]POX38959.1 galactose-1-epimerase [Streptomyces sp. Ru73]
MSATHVAGEPFGTSKNGSIVHRWTLEAGAVRVRILTYGGIVQSIETPGRHGERGETVLGFPDLAGYEAHGESYFGALVGRYANRIGGAAFTLDGKRYALPANDGPNCLHGGVANFSTAVWDAAPCPDGVELRRVSADGEEGFPGAVDVRVRYTLSAAGELTCDYRATSDAPTVVNLTNHTYFNLSGDGSGGAGTHRLRMAADHYLPVDGTGVPTGPPAPVTGTRFDFRARRTVGRGYDHTFVVGDGAGTIGAPSEEPPAPRPVAELSDPASGRTVRLSTTEPGVQLYTAEHLDGTYAGTTGRPYVAGAGIALETQHFPDSPNRPDFPGTVLRPGQVFRSRTVYGFGVEA